ncbi:unnamed protein product [Paramecium primaurelia]|uniref:Uncharacterized protein n=1 Tax=Paramecium primaurelia TaxID=5886 RepID=A0A8S1K7J3_PARPR|nr:unnamed protein product [Paramecium primaurelia]
MVLVYIDSLPKEIKNHFKYTLDPLLALSSQCRVTYKNYKLYEKQITDQKKSWMKQKAFIQKSSQLTKGEFQENKIRAHQRI